MSVWSVGIIGGADGPTSIFITSSNGMFYNAGSILFGLAALVMPIISIIRCVRLKQNTRTVFSAASMGLCSVSLYFQILSGNYLVQKHDWAGLEDTSEAAAGVSLLFLLTAAALNVFALLYKNRER